MTAQLKQLRDKIDAIDSELLKLMSERASLAREIGQIKNGMAYRPEREAQVLARLCKLNPGPLANEHIVRLFTEIMSLCRSMEEPLTVAYLGPQGTFSEEAALKRFGGVVTTLACTSIDDVFRKVESRRSRLWGRAGGEFHRRRGGQVAGPVAANAIEGMWRNCVAYTSASACAARDLARIKKFTLIPNHSLNVMSGLTPTCPI